MQDLHFKWPLDGRQISIAYDSLNTEDNFFRIYIFVFLSPQLPVLTHCHSHRPADTLYAVGLDFSVIITISHLLLLFISSFTDAPYASLFDIVYTYAYSTQSPNIALLSCLLRTLGIVIHLHAQYTSCLLRTLAV